MVRLIPSVGMTPQWVEAISAAGAAGATVFLAFLTGRTLFVLRGYANDTKTLAEISIEQLKASHNQLEIFRDQVEASYAPFVVLLRDQLSAPLGSTVYRIVN